MVICNFVQTIVTNGISGSILSTIQKEFFLTSFQGGLFIAIHDLTAFFAAPVVGYFGDLKRINKMRFISLNMIMVSIGAYLIGILVFLKAPDASIHSKLVDSNVCRLNQSLTNLAFVCSPMNTSSTSISVDGANSLGYLLFVGNGVIGIGSVALFSVGIVYIEEIVPEDKSAMCQAIYNGVGKYEYLI